MSPGRPEVHSSWTRSCAETKMTGAPAFGTTPARRATSDWSNRRKELKFVATDLKLYWRQQETQIDHWDSWRRKQPPKTYFLWCARMTPKDNLTMMSVTKENVSRSTLSS